MTCGPTRADATTRTRSRRPFRAARRRWYLTALVCLAMQLLAPRPAHAWWGWLDNLSGPGPWWGPEFDFRLVCFPGKTTVADAKRASIAAAALLQRAQTVTAQDVAARSRTWDAIGESGKDNYEKMLKASDDLTTWPSTFRSPPSREATSALEKAARLWRLATQPRFPAGPGWVLDSNCSDSPLNSPVRASAVFHGDRKVSPSIVISYQHLSTSQPPDSPFAPDHTISLQAIEPRFTWPMSGHLDFVEGQSGIGRYWMTSDSFDSFSGWIFEPILVNVHVPAKIADKNAWMRVASAFSWKIGLVMFPGGFAANAFNRTGSSPQLSSREATVESGLVINLGRFIH
jgi:hypothetical protein